VCHTYGKIWPSAPHSLNLYSLSRLQIPFHFQGPENRDMFSSRLVTHSVCLEQKRS